MSQYPTHWSSKVQGWNMHCDVQGSPSAFLGWQIFVPSASHQLDTHWSRVVVPARVSTHGCPTTGSAAHFPVPESQ